MWRGSGRRVGCVEEGHYVGQCLKASPRKWFSFGEMGHYHYSIEEVPCVLVAESWVTRRVRIRKWYGGTSVSCQTNAFQEKMYTNLGN